MARLTAGRSPLFVLDTHAGRGLYDLSGDEAQRSGEARAGIARLGEALRETHWFDLREWSTSGPGTEPGR